MSTITGHGSQIQRPAIVVLFCIILAWSFGSLMVVGDVETLRASVILTVLLFISLVVFWLVSRSDPEGRLLFVLLFASLALKLLALYFRFYTNLFADAYSYNNAGRGIADQLANGLWPFSPRFSGTFFVRLLTGVTYFMLGTSFVGISILWTWFGLMGMLLYYKAFTTAFPEGHRRLYLFLILFYPSVLLWTSSLGKDALMMMAAGTAVYGMARLRRGLDIMGLVCVPLGFAGMFAIRPHIAAIFAVAAGISTVTHPIGAGRLTPVIRIVGLAVALGLAVGVAITASRLVGLESLEAEEVEQFISARQHSTGERGGSSFTQVDTSSPLGLALLVPTVLFRPFPIEAHNMSAMIASMEGLGLLGLILYRFRSVRAAVGGVTKNNFLLFSVIFALMFIYLFSAITNFGIIARQRVQVFPFVFMWLAYLGPRKRPAHGGPAGFRPRGFPAAVE